MANPKSPNKQTRLPNDGERMIPEHHRNTMGYGDHIARYESAMPFVNGKTVLDIACGSGYGTQMLARTAKSVHGVDIEKDAVQYAIENFDAPNVHFQVGSGTDIPLADASVDTVVTFETLEHIEDYKKFLSEIKRVLNDDGQLVLSTPNDREFPEGNHFHVHEFEYEELIGLLKKQFKHVETYYQATWVYTGLSKGEKMFKEWDESIRVINTAPISRDQALYFMAICSNEPIKQTVETLGVISEHWSGKQIGAQNREVQDYIKRTIKHYEGILKAKDEQIGGLNQTVAQQRQRLQRFTSHPIVRARSYIKSKIRK